jgi:hypothetical protein
MCTYMLIDGGKSMSQITLYVLEAEARAIRRAARAARQSVSQWARERMVAGLQPGWPDGYFDLLGALKDDSLVRPPPPPAEADVRREGL